MPPIAWIKTIEPEDASDPLVQAYEQAKTPHGAVDNVMKVHSLRPRTMEGHLALYPAGVRQPLYGAFVVKNVCRAVHVFSSIRVGLRIRFPRPAAVEMTIGGGARFRARSPRTTLYSVAPGGAVP
jgi:hypothetical protein